MYVLTTVIIIALLLGLFGLTNQISLAKQHHSEDSKAQADTTTTKDTTDSTKSDIIPIEPPAADTTPTAPPVTSTLSPTCNESSNDAECVAAQTIAKQTQEQIALNERLLQQQEQQRIAQENNDKIINDLTTAGQELSSIDSGGSSNSGSSGTSSSDDQQEVTTDGQKDAQIDSESHYIVMVTEDGPSMFKILSSEKALDTTVLPKLIRPIFTGGVDDSIQRIIEYDNAHL